MTQQQCRWPKGHPRYIDPLELKGASLRERLEYRRITAIEEQNDIEAERIEIERERNFLTLQSIKRSIWGAIIAASIGACALIYVNVFKYRESDKLDRIKTTMLNFSQVESDIHYIGNQLRNDGTLCKTNQRLLVDIHRQYHPEKYPNVFGNFKPLNQKKGK